MIASTSADNSELALMREINKLSDAGGSVIQITTREPIRAAIALRKHLIASEVPYKEWDVSNGWRVFTKENYTDYKVKGQNEDFATALNYPLEQLRSATSVVTMETDKVFYFAYLNPNPYIDRNPLAIELIQQYANLLPTTNVCLLFITTESTLPGVPVGTVLTCSMQTPSAAELETRVRAIVKESADGEEGKRNFPQGIKVLDSDYKRIAQMGLGLSLFEFETYVAISVIDAGLSKERAITTDRVLAGVAEGKTSVVRQSEILELTTPEDISNVGGMHKLKRWVAARSECYSEDAIEFGVEPPKGMVLVGVPGTGKSLVAKVCASVLEIPLVRFDIARVFSKYVGDSESRVRDALKMIESMAPVVLFVDEIDKGLGGAGNGGDGGTSSRVLGTFLTWLQECSKPVFTVVTANRVNGLPPELLRRGRFDQIWSVSMPNEDARREVLAIHLRKRGRSIEDFDENEIQSFIAASNDYVSAEIEAAVKGGIIGAFHDKTAQKLEMRHLLKELKEIIPMSRSHAAAIAQITEWAATNAISVDGPEESVGLPPPARTARAIRVGRGR